MSLNVELCDDGYDAYGVITENSDNNRQTIYINLNEIEAFIDKLQDLKTDLIKSKALSR